MLIMGPVMSQPPSSGHFIYKDTDLLQFCTFIQKVNGGAGYGLEYPSLSAMIKPSVASYTKKIGAWSHGRGLGRFQRSTLFVLV